MTTEMSFTAPPCPSISPMRIYRDPVDVDVARRVVGGRAAGELRFGLEDPMHRCIRNALPVDANLLAVKNESATSWCPDDHGGMPLAVGRPGRVRRAVAVRPSIHGMYVRRKRAREVPLWEIDLAVAATAAV